MDRFALSSNDCELLLELERHGSIQTLANAMSKDPSVISRNLKNISEKSSVLEKENGRWTLTQQGLSLNKWTREAIYAQRQAINQMKILKVGATREFASKILLPSTRSLVGESDISLSILTSDLGMEKMIGTGEVDFGFDCGRPIDPSIAFKTVLDESFGIFASPQFIEKYKIKKYKDLEDKDLLKFTRTEDLILDLNVRATRYYGTFSDVSSLREACVLGYGWAILPHYAVRRELKAGSLQEVHGLKIKPARYGVWWLRERRSIQPWVEKALDWLKEQDLSR